MEAFFLSALCREWQAKLIITGNIGEYQLYHFMQRSGGKMHLNKRDDTTNERSRGEKDTVLNLVEECKNGSRSAQKKLYDALSPKMFALCIRYMGDRDSAEDVLQDGFVTLFTKLDTFSGEGSFEGWARKIFVNTALMSLRKVDALKMSDDLETAWNVSSDLTTQIQNIGFKELMKMISELPSGYRAVFNMSVIEGYNHKEIAAALGITEATSRSQLLRARNMLQEKIKKY